MSSPAYMGSRLLSGLCQPPVTRYCVQPPQKKGVIARCGYSNSLQQAVKRHVPDWVICPSATGLV